ncbi:MAG: hypothetical protein ACOH1P_00815 [Lysobacter sp.]
MKPLHAFACGLALAAALVGCQQSTGRIHSHSVMQHIRLDGDRVGTGGPDGTTAWIDASGSLQIRGKDVALTVEQRALASSYHAEAMGLKADGIAIGKSGAALAGKVIGAVASGLASGDPDSIGTKIEADAKQIETRALAVCQRVATLQQSQDALARSLPVFAPYATITDASAADCRTNNTPVDENPSTAPSA